MAQSAYVRRTSPPAAIVAVAIMAGTAVAGWTYVDRIKARPLSPNASITANVVNIAATVSGRIETIAVAENQRVAQGDILFAIDAQPYRLAVAQAKADLALAEAALEAQRHAILMEQSNAMIANQETVRATTNLALAEATLSRLTPLAPRGYVSAEEIDVAEAARTNALTSLDQAQRQQDAAAALVSTLDASEALVEARKFALALAQHDLEATIVRAPLDGAVAGLTVGAGEIVAQGQPIFTLIDTGDWFVTAIYPETQLGHIAKGDCARVYLLADRTRVILGRVEGIGWGVHASNESNLLRGLPKVPNTGNWVRIVQSFPVRIRLAHPPQDLMRIGSSALTVVQDGNDC